RDDLVTGVQTCALPISVCSITHGAILLAGAGTERGCAEALPSANTASVIAEKQSSTPIKTRSLKNPPSLRLWRTSLRADFFFIRSEERRVGKGVRYRWS